MFFIFINFNFNSSNNRKHSTYLNEKIMIERGCTLAPLFLKAFLFLDITDFSMKLGSNCFSKLNYYIYFSLVVIRMSKNMLRTLLIQMMHVSYRMS